MKIRSLCLFLAIVFCLSFGAPTFALAEEICSQNEYDQEVETAFLQGEETLTTFSEDNNTNIVILDEFGNTLSEYHSDGLAVQFHYSEETIPSISAQAGQNNTSTSKLEEITDNQGRKVIYKYDNEGNIHRIDYCTSDNVIIQSDVYPSLENQAGEHPNSILSSYTPFYVYHSNGTSTNMSTLFEDENKFLRCRSCPGVDAIQEIFEENNSPLKDRIDVYVRNGSSITWSQTIIPSQNIHDISVRTNVAPKVILATLQKESSLVDNSRDTNYKADYFYFCMGAGSSTSSSNTGFPNQIKLGAETLYRHYNTGLSFTYPYLYSHSGFYGYHGYGTSGRETQIWVNNAATYSLYKYTPYTCANNSSTYTANVAFKDIYYSTSGCLKDCAE